MRVLKITALVFTFLFIWSLFMAEAKGRKIKVYLDAPDVAYNGSFSMYILDWMRIVDEEDDSFEWEWVSDATKAEFIITITMDKNPLPVKIGERKNGEAIYCTQFLTDVHLWKKGSKKTHEMVNLQLDCNPNAIAERAVKDLVTAMGLNERRNQAHTVSVPVR